MALSDVSNFWGFEIANPISSNVLDSNYTQFTTTPTDASILATIPTFPFRARLATVDGQFELITVTAKSLANIWTITREEEGTTALEFPAGSRLECVFTKGHWDEIKLEFTSVSTQINDVIAAMFYAALGGKKAVLQNGDSYNFLKAVPDGGLAIEVLGGYAFILENLFKLTSPVNFTIVPPVLGERIDIIVATSAGILIKTGEDDNAPGGTNDGLFVDVGFTYPIPDADPMIALCKVTVPVGSALVKDINDTPGVTDTTLEDVRPYP